MQVAADCFDLAQESVVQSLEKEYFPDFLTSQYHAKHQVHCICTVHLHTTPAHLHTTPAHTHTCTP